MRLRKTPANKRYRQEKDGTRVPIYTMCFDNGDKVIFEPGKATTIYASGNTIVQFDEGITELTIKQCHSDDDAEVESNINMVRCETRGMRKEREKNKKEWAEKHPKDNPDDNPYNPKRKLVSLDGKPTDDFESDHSKLQLEFAEAQEDDADFSDERLELVKAYVATLPKSQQELYQLLYVEGLSQVQICERLKLTKGTVSKRTKNLNQKLFSKFKK